MANLKTLIQRLEKSVSSTEIVDRRNLLTLASLYNFVDSAKVSELVEKIITETNDNISLEAMLYNSRALLSNRKVAEAIQTVEQVLETIKAQTDKSVRPLAEIHELFLYPYKKEKEAGQLLLEKLAKEPALLADTALGCLYHQAAADFLRESDIESANAHLYEALEVNKSLKRPWIEGFILCKLGMLADARKDLAQAEKHFDTALPLLLDNDCTQYLFQVYVCYAKLYIGKKEFEKAIHFAELAFIAAEKIQLTAAMDFALMHKATALLWLKRFDEVESLATQLLATATEDMAKGNYLNMLSNSAFQQDKIEKAITLAEQYYALRKDNLRPQDLIPYHHKMQSYHSKINNYKEAFEHLTKRNEIEIARLNESKASAVAEMQAKYEAEKREAELRESRLQQTESELKALKAQMNPHFIFNALNSIQEIFFLGDKRLANKHLARFSQLMRTILKASSQKAITLDEEITMLREYLTLEGLRFGEDFSFEISVDENVDLYTFDIPPMIIQPFVENAVKHGLLHKEGEQKITLHFSFDEERSCIEVQIKDNGVGRKASAAINQHRKNHESFSTSATEKRFEILNQNRDTKFEFGFDDVENEAGEALGTVVSMTMPIE